MTDFAAMMTSVNFSDENNFEPNCKINEKETIGVNRFLMPLFNIYHVHEVNNILLNSFLLLFNLLCIVQSTGTNVCDGSRKRKIFYLVLFELRSKLNHYFGILKAVVKIFII